MEGKPGKEKSEGFWREMRAGVPHVSHPLRDMGFHSSIPVRALGGLVFRLPHFNRGWPILAFFARVGIHNPYSEGFTGGLAPAFPGVFVCSISTEGAPSLRSLQGWEFVTRAAKGLYPTENWH